VAVDATARLYDVDEDSVVFKKLQQSEKYDQGTVTFRARPGKLIDLDKLHESVWATRLSGGTRSGLVSLEVVTVGEAIKTQDALILKVAGGESEFVLAPSAEPKDAALFASLQEMSEGSSRMVRVTGTIDNYKGRWPTLFLEAPAKPRRILVKAFEAVE
jgi:hypothetical protein